MASDRRGRINLQRAVVDYMNGTIRTYEFDERNCIAQSSLDNSVQRISRFLYSLHDDFIDHPISVSQVCWEALVRVIAFLGTELEIGRVVNETSWPFRDDDEWHANAIHLNEIRLPDYDPSVHSCSIQPWWNRIPSSVGFLILGGILLCLAVTLSFL